MARAGRIASGAGGRRAHEGGAVVAYELKAATTEWNPPAERLRELTELMPNSQKMKPGKPRLSSELSPEVANLARVRKLKRAEHQEQRAAIHPDVPWVPEGIQ